MDLKGAVKVHKGSTGPLALRRCVDHYGLRGGCMRTNELYLQSLGIKVSYSVLFFTLQEKSSAFNMSIHTVLQWKVTMTN